MEIAQTSSQLTSQAEQPHMVACPRCRSSNEPGSRYCYSCGLPLDGAATFTPSSAASAAAPDAGQRAGFWIRLVAYLIDGVLLSVTGFAIAAILSSGWDTAAPPAEAVTATDLVGLLLNVLYFTIGVAVWSTTIGKRVFGLYVVRPDGSRVGFGRALARYFAYFLSIAILFIGFIMIGVRQDKRGLHDLICDTVVVKR